MASIPSIRRKELAALLLLIAVLGTAVFTSHRGIDFGFHWDEPKLLGAVVQSARDGLVLPRWYNYPSVCYDLCILSLAAKYVEHRGELASASVEQLHAWLVDTASSEHFKLRMRRLFIAISYLSVIWVYAAVRVLRGRPWEALLAAAFLGLSWEVQYHSRWIAPDVVMMQFAAMTLLFSVLVLKGRRWKPWLVAASISAGLACATKYQAGALLLLVGMAAAVRCASESTRLSDRIRSTGLWSLTAFALLCATFLLTTPGVWIQPRQFITDVTYEINHYKVAGHGGHTLTPGLEHLFWMLAYYALAFFSKYDAVALLCFAMALHGAVLLFKEDRGAALTLLAFPVFYLLYMSTQRVLIARNLLILGPFLATFAAVSCAGIYRRWMQRPWSRRAYVLVITGLLAANAVWLRTAAYTIARRDQAKALRELADYMRAHPGTRFVVTQHVREALAATPLSDLAPAPRGEGEALAILYMDDVKDWTLFKAYQPNQYTLLDTGPYEINIDYYPNWAGDDRIVLMPASRAEAMGLTLQPFP